MHNIDIRSGCENDIAALTELYNHYITNSAITFDIEPTTARQRGEWLTQFKPDSPHQLFVAVDAQHTVLGYACSAALHKKAAYASSVEVSIYLSPEAGGKGVGSALYEHLLQALSRQSLHRAYALITQPNEASNALHHRFGFTSVGIMTEVGYKFDQYWDVAWYEKCFA